MASPEHELRAIEYGAEYQRVKQEKPSSPFLPPSPPSHTFNPIRHWFTFLVLLAFYHLITQVIFNGTRDERELPSGRELHLSLTKDHKWRGALFLVEDQFDIPYYYGPTHMALETLVEEGRLNIVVLTLDNLHAVCGFPAHPSRDNSRFLDCYTKNIEHLVRERTINVIITNETFKNSQHLIFSMTKRVLSTLNKVNTKDSRLPTILKLYTLQTPNLISRFVGPITPFLTKCERIADSVIYVIEYVIVLFFEYFSVGSGSSHRRWAHAIRLAEETPLSPMLVYMSSWYDWWDTVEKAWRSSGFRWTAGLHLVFSRYMWVNELVEEVI